MRKTVISFALTALFYALCPIAEAQQPKKIPRIGYVSTSGDPNTSGTLVKAFRQGLRDHGYIEGKNILVEYRYPEGNLDRVPGIVAELVQLNVDVLVSGNLSVIREAKQATKTIPVVMITSVDPVAAGLIDSLARPGGNVTGLTRLTRELSGKRLELLTEVVPGRLRVGVLWNATAPSSAAIAFKEYEVAAPLLKVQLESLEVGAPNPDLEGAFKTAAKKHVRAIITIRDALLNRHPKQIADLAIKNRLPLMCEGNEYVEAGALVSYATSDADQYHRAALYVDKILQGTKPADLPVQQPMKFEFVINLKTAKAIGLTIPPNVLARADKIIK